MSKHNEKPTSFYHHKDRKNRSRSRSHSYIKDKKNHSKSSISPIKHKSNEYYIEKYRALYQTNGGSLKEKHKHEKINPLKKEEKDESIIFFRKKYGGEIRNLHTKHSDVFRVVKKEAKVGKKLEIKQKKEENAGKNYKEIKSNYISHKTLKNSKISEKKLECSDINELREHSSKEPNKYQDLRKKLNLNPKTRFSSIVERIKKNK